MDCLRNIILLIDNKKNVVEKNYTICHVRIISSCGVNWYGDLQLLKESYKVTVLSCKIGKILVKEDYLSLFLSASCQILRKKHLSFKGKRPNIETTKKASC